MRILQCFFILSVFLQFTVSLHCSLFIHLFLPFIDLLSYRLHDEACVCCVSAVDLSSRRDALCVSVLSVWLHVGGSVSGRPGSDPLCCSSVSQNSSTRAADDANTPHDPVDPERKSHHHISQTRRQLRASLASLPHCKQ